MFSLLYEIFFAVDLVVMEIIKITKECETLKVVLYLPAAIQAIKTMKQF